MLLPRPRPHLLERWLPSGLTEDQRARTLVFLSVACAALGFSLVSVLQAWVTGLFWALWLNAGNAVLAIASILAGRAAQRRAIAVHTLLAAFTASLVVGSLATTPFDYSALSFLVLLPLAAATVLGARATWVWVGLCAAAGLGAVVAGARGVTLGEVDPTPVLTQSLNLLFVLFGCVTVVLVFWREKERTLVRMREAEAGQRRFFANVGHDLRTPMNGVLGLADALIDEPLTARQHEMVEAIRSSGSVLVGLLNDLLDLSKAEAGRMELHPTPLVVEVLAQELRGLWGPTAQKKGLDLRIVVDPALPAAITVDGVRLRQVINNLVANALKFTEQGRVEFRLGRDGDTLELVVTDTGPGIGAEAQAKLFQPFSHADDERTRPNQGAGLGLAVSALLCATMGGHLTLQSERGKGSTFRAVLPLVAAQLPADALTAEAATPAGLRVLVVDDNAINRLVARRLFEARGCQVSEAPSGDSALGLVLPLGFDLVLMDLSMPGKDGLETTTALRAAGYAGLIIGLSATVAEATRQACLTAGMDDTLPKPLRAEAVRHVLAVHFARPRHAA